MTKEENEKLQEVVKQLDTRLGIKILLEGIRQHLNTGELTAAGVTARVLYCFREHMTVQENLILNKIHSKIHDAVQECIPMLDELLQK